MPADERSGVVLARLAAHPQGRYWLGSGTPAAPPGADPDLTAECVARALPDILRRAEIGYAIPRTGGAGPRNLARWAAEHLVGPSAGAPSAGRAVDGEAQGPGRRNPQVMHAVRRLWRGQLWHLWLHGIHTSQGDVTMLAEARDLRLELLSPPRLRPVTTGLLPSPAAQSPLLWARLAARLDDTTGVAEFSAQLEARLDAPMPTDPSAFPGIEEHQLVVQLYARLWAPEQQARIEAVLRPRLARLERVWHVLLAHHPLTTPATLLAMLDAYPGRPRRAGVPGAVQEPHDLRQMLRPLLAHPRFPAARLQQLTHDLVAALRARAADQPLTPPATRPPPTVALPALGQIHDYSGEQLAVLLAGLPLADPEARRCLVQSGVPAVLPPLDAQCATAGELWALHQEAVARHLRSPQAAFGQGLLTWLHATPDAIARADTQVCIARELSGVTAAGPAWIPALGALLRPELLDGAARARLLASPLREVRLLVLQRLGTPGVCGAGRADARRPTRRSGLPRPRRS